MGRIQNWMRPIAVHSELDNFLIIVVIWDGYSAVVAVLCVVDRRWRTIQEDGIHGQKNQKNTQPACSVTG